MYIHAIDTHYVKQSSSLVLVCRTLYIPLLFALFFRCSSASALPSTSYPFPISPSSSSLSVSLTVRKKWSFITGFHSEQKQGCFWVIYYFFSSFPIVPSLPPL